MNFFKVFLLLGHFIFGASAVSQSIGFLTEFEGVSFENDILEWSLSPTETHLWVTTEASSHHFRHELVQRNSKKRRLMFESSAFESPMGWALNKYIILRNQAKNEFSIYDFRIREKMKSLRLVGEFIGLNVDDKRKTVDFVSVSETGTVLRFDIHSLHLPSITQVKMSYEILGISSQTFELIKGHTPHSFYIQISLTSGFCRKIVFQVQDFNRRLWAHDVEDLERCILGPHGFNLVTWNTENKTLECPWSLRPHQLRCKSA